MDLATGPLTTAPDASGAIDAKLSSASWMASADGAMRVLAKSGPTFETQKPFQWSTSAFNHIAHIGLPDLFNFEWVDFEVAALPTPTAAAKSDSKPVVVDLADVSIGTQSASA